MKSGIIKCLRNRLDRIRDKSTKRDELNHLRSVLQANGYPPQVVSRALRPRAQFQQDLDAADNPKILYLPYIQHITEPIQQVCRKLGVKIVFRTPQTLRQQLVRLKTARPKLKKNVIYKVPCLDCTSVYIGEMGRCLQVRLTEHKAAVRRGDRKNGIATHAWHMTQPYGTRFIAASHKCTTKPVSRLLTSCFTNHYKQYCNSIFCKTGVNCFHMQHLRRL